MANTIRVLKAKCASGKTRKYAIPRMLEDTGTKFLYIAPTISLLNEVDSEITRRLVEGQNQEPATPFARAARQAIFSMNWQRIDGEHGSEGKGVQRAIDEALNDLMPCRCLGITHAAAASMPGRLAEGRCLIIDEALPWMSFRPEPPVTWELFIAKKWITIIGGDVTLTPDGERQKRQRPQGVTGRSYQELLTQIGPGAKVDETSGILYDSIPFKTFAAADEVVLMAANPDVGYFRQWLEIHQVQEINIPCVEAGLPSESHACVNSTVYYLEEEPEISSKYWIEKKVGVRTGDKSVDRHRYSTWPTKVKNLLAPGGCLSGGKSLWTCNGDRPYQAMSAQLPKRSYISIGQVHGVNEHDQCDRLIFLGAIRPTTDTVNLVYTLSKAQSRKAVASTQHIETMYQFVMRGVLRKDEAAECKILVPTQGDALALAARLGTSKVEKAWRYQPTKPRSAA